MACTITITSAQTMTMTAKTYICRRYRSTGAFEWSADLVQAASPIHFRMLHDDDDAPWQPTPFQVADGRHDKRRIEAMIASYLNG